MNIIDKFPWRIQSQLGYRPCRCFKKTKDYCTVHPRNTYSELIPGGVFNLEAPKTVQREKHPEFDLNISKEYTEAFMASIHGGRVFMHIGLEGIVSVITPENCLLSDISTDPYYRKIHPVLTEFKLPKSKFIKGNAYLIATPDGNGNYYHWMAEQIPRVGLLNVNKSDIRFNRKMHEIDYFITTKLMHPFQKDSLHKLNIPEEKIFQINNGEHFQFEHLIVPSLLSFNPWVYHFFQRSFIDKLNFENKKHSKRIYVSRRKAGWRKILNEELLIEELTGNFGFVEVFSEEYSLEEQASMFHEAEVIVSPHGAALTNLFFCKENTKIIELFSPEYVNIIYWIYANYAKLDYYYIIGNSCEKNISNPFTALRSDFLINIEDVKKTLNCLCGVI